MMNALRVVLVIAIGSLEIGCLSSAPYQCHTPFAHPTMTTGSVAVGVDARVREQTEGAKGTLGAQ